jgi:hypothetical protein
MSRLFRRKPKKPKELENKTKLTIYKDGTFVFSCDSCNIASTGFLCKHFLGDTEIIDKRKLIKVKK